MNREEERMKREVELIDVLLKIMDFTKEDWDIIINAVADEFMEQAERNEQRRVCERME